MPRLIISILVVLALSREGMAQALHDVTAPGDMVVGVPDDGDWPAAERPELAIDDKISTKYLHFKGDFNPNVGPVGLRVTPSVGPTIVTGLTFSTANDYPGRDPVAFALYGSNGTIDGPYVPIAAGDIPDFRGAVAWPRLTRSSTPIAFPNQVEYEHYQLLFTAIRGPVGGGVNSMQIAEVELLGRRSLKATGPRPTEGAACTNTWVNLSWRPGDRALSHQVYFSSSRAAVTQRQSSALIARTGAPSTTVGRPGSAFPSALRMGTTYYWCVDELNEAEPDGPWRGDVWSFRVPAEPAVYLLITNERLAPAFEPLVQRRTKQGLPGRLLAVENIYATYTGKDEPEQIRNCIIDHYTRYGTQYVSLGGDQVVVPVRWCDPNTSGDRMPADLYYADTDGSDWDLNRNGIYGEANEVTEIELTPEVHLGRIPLRTSEHATAYINKVVTYESASPDGFANSMILFGSMGLGSGSERRQDHLHHDPVDSAEFQQMSAYYHFIQPYWQAVPLHFFWDAYSSWDVQVCGDYNLTLDRLIEKINQGYHFLFYFGHGNPTLWGIGGRRLTAQHAASLTNSIPCIVTAYSCATALFDSEGTCMSDAFLQNSHGGAVAYLGFARSTHATYQCHALFQALFETRPVCIGEAMTLCKVARAPYQVGKPCEQYNFVLHGDPCIRLLWEESGRHLQVFQPKGCEMIERGTDFYVRWNAAGTGFRAGEKVKLEYSNDSGRTWYPIPGAEGLTYNGRSFRWRNCPLPAGSRYRVRVVSLSDPRVSDMSGRDFTIGDLAFLTVQATPVEGVAIDLSGSKTTHCTLTTDFNITILKGASVSLSAPAVTGESSRFSFVRWTDETGKRLTSAQTYTFVLTQDRTVIAEYRQP